MSDILVCKKMKSVTIIFAEIGGLKMYISIASDNIIERAELRWNEVSFGNFMDSRGRSVDINEIRKIILKMRPDNPEMTFWLAR